MMAERYFLPPLLFDKIKAYAETAGMDEITKIVSKLDHGAIILEPWEADLLHKIGQLWQLEAELKFPFWNSDTPRFDEQHSEAFSDARGELFEKILMTFPPL